MNNFYLKNQIKWNVEFIILNKALEGIVLSIEVQSVSDNDRNPNFIKKKIGSVLANTEIEKSSISSYINWRFI